jgi:hypothetical protein
VVRSRPSPEARAAATSPARRGALQLYKSAVQLYKSARAGDAAPAVSADRAREPGRRRCLLLLPALQLRQGRTGGGTRPPIPPPPPPRSAGLTSRARVQTRVTAAVVELLSGLVSNLLGATVLGVAGAHDPDARESSDQAPPLSSPRPAPPRPAPRRRPFQTQSQP